MIHLATYSDIFKIRSNWYKILFFYHPFYLYLANLCLFCMFIFQRFYQKKKNLPQIFFTRWSKNKFINRVYHALIFIFTYWFYVSIENFFSKKDSCEDEKGGKKILKGQIFLQSLHDKSLCLQIPSYPIFFICVADGVAISMILSRAEIATRTVP